VDLLNWWKQLLVPYLRARFEYALLVALIAVVCIVAIQFLGSNASNKLSKVGSSVGS
jgi:pilus assembly protein Flp/PilA